MKRTELCGKEYVDVDGIRWWNAHECHPPKGANVVVVNCTGVIRGAVWEHGKFWTPSGYTLVPDWWSAVRPPDIVPRR